MAHPERISEFSGHLYEVHAERYRFAEPYCRNASVVDIACGTGYGSDNLARSAQQVVGIDVSREAVQSAAHRFRARNLRYMLGSGTDIPLASRSADVVVSFETIEHVDDHRAMFAELHRVTRPGGIVIISTPNKTVSEKVQATPNPFHVREFTGEEFAALLHEFFAGAAIELFVQQRYAPMTGVAGRINPLLKRVATAAAAIDRLNLRHKIAGRAIDRAGARYVDQVSLDVRILPAAEAPAPALIQLAVIRT